jgi:hypothetical protein
MNANIRLFFFLSGVKRKGSSYKWELRVSFTDKGGPVDTTGWFIILYDNHGKGIIKFGTRSKIPNYVSVVTNEQSNDLMPFLKMGVFNKKSQLAGYWKVTLPEFPVDIPEYPSNVYPMEVQLEPPIEM